MKNRTKFKGYNPDQLYLLAPDLKDWLSESDLAYFIMDVMVTLDQVELSGTASYDKLYLAACVGSPTRC